MVWSATDSFACCIFIELLGFNGGSLDVDDDATALTCTGRGAADVCICEGGVYMRVAGKVTVLVFSGSASSTSMSSSCTFPESLFERFGGQTCASSFPVVLERRGRFSVLRKPSSTSMGSVPLVPSIFRGRGGGVGVDVAVSNGSLSTGSRSLRTGFGFLGGSMRVLESGRILAG